MKNWILALGALSLAGTACDPIVLEPLKGTQNAVAPVVSGGGAASGSKLLAIRGGDVNWQNNNAFVPWKDETWSDPDTLVLFFSADLQQCGNPVLPDRCLGAGPFWQAIFAIPPALARPGLIDLQDPRITVASSTSFPDGTLQCGGGGFLGPGMSGTFELSGDGSTSLSVKVMDVQVFGNSVVNGVDQGPIELDGDYLAEICGTLAPAAPPNPALAIRGVDLPAPPGGGASPDPDSLVVFLGTLPFTCQDPWASCTLTSATRLTFTLPLGLQKPGVISLSDPAIASTLTLVVAQTCGEPTGPMASGTIEILTSDTGELTFKVHDSYTGFNSDPSLALDGLYSAPICP
jgi:hypothetical protein